MNTQRPVTLIIAAGLLIVLLLLGAILPLFAGPRSFGRGVRPGGEGVFQGGGGQGNSFGNGQGGFQDGGQGNSFGNSNSSSPGQFPRQGLFNLFRVFRTVQIVISFILLGIGLIAAYGLWKMKKWGMVWAIILSALSLIVVLPGLFRIFSFVQLAEALMRIAVAIAVIVLVLLPVSRRVYT